MPSFFSLFFKRSKLELLEQLISSAEAIWLRLAAATNLTQPPALALLDLHKSLWLWLKNLEFAYHTEGYVWYILRVVRCMAKDLQSIKVERCEKFANIPIKQPSRLWNSRQKSHKKKKNSKEALDMNYRCSHSCSLNDLVNVQSHIKTWLAASWVTEILAKLRLNY